MDRYLRAFLENNSVVLTEIYKIFLKIKRVILANSGTEEDAEDLFQDAMLAMYQKAQGRKKFPEDSDFQRYFMGVCWRLWLKALKKRRRQVTSRPEWEYEIEGIVDEVEEDIRQHEQRKLIDKHLQNMRERCQKIIRWWSEKVPMIEIAHRMNFKSEDVAKKEAMKCRMRLDDRVKNDPDYEDLFDI